ncbi:MAG: YibE/F family protein [Actinomycetota bacterium]|nr:YibE/F family protein [Actinomycetota bacterium]
MPGHGHPHGHDHGHDHDRGHGQDAVGPEIARWLRLVVAVVGLATVVGLAVLWPRGPGPDLRGTTSALDYVDARVESTSTDDCIDPAEQLPTECQIVEVTITSGATNGDRARVLIPSIDVGTPELAPGDRVVLVHNELAPPDFQYVFVEYQRRTPLVLLGVLFAVVVVGFGRWKGVRALAGLVMTVGVVIVFLLPSLLRGNNAIAVALVATSVVAFAALYVTHGVSNSTTVALVGTMASVLLITALAAVVTGIAHLSGLSDESFQVLRVTAEAIDPRGLLVAGIVIGALGVLDDVTITQVTAVNELRRADPSMSRVEVYRAAVRIGRDHVASTVNTLVLAYVGASLALLLFFFEEGRAVSQVLNREVVAIEIVRTLIGSIGLILSVPVTTALAAATTDPPDGGPRAVDPPSTPRPPDWSDFAPDEPDG